MDACACGIVPGAVPEILGEDRELPAFAMAWFPPDEYPVWKKLLVQGKPIRGRPPWAMCSGASMREPPTSRTSRRASPPTLFQAIRLDPYLVTAARAPGSRAPLLALVATTGTTRRVLVHGDFSPKNILSAAKAGHPRRRMRVVRRSGVSTWPSC
jgi:hypothetical protein